MQLLVSVLFNKKLKFYLISSLLFIFISNGYASLSISTANSIQGRMPELSLDNGITPINHLSDLLSFDMPDGSDGTITISTDTNDIIQAEPSYKFNQFVTKVIADNSAKNLSEINNIAYYDSDNDLPDNAEPIKGSIVATWSYQQFAASGTTITKTLTQSDLAKQIDACNAPYTLTISVSNAAVQSRYGLPLDQVYGSLSKSYVINVSDYKFCWARPNAITVSNDQWIGSDTGSWNTGNTDTDPQKGGRYSDDFLPFYGFKANPINAVNKFPTTGFPKAKFQLLMSNSQTDYTYRALENGVDSDNVGIDLQGNVTINSKPDDSVTIRATPTNSNYPAMDYQFTITTWAIPQVGANNWNNSYIKCGSKEQVLTRAELTNSPQNNAPLRWSYFFNSYTRAIGGGIANEWGALNQNTYPNSNWTGILQWTQDPQATNYQFSVFSSDGRVSYTTYNYGSGGIACKG